ncbi:MAG: hypothetical protein A2845_05600 [Candidatus Lloydbacteria bacterium RIFCSPHIGHO2_01_FULL_49_22]|uniref:Uncharacterized protein n=1 Tax=Candidatus Lloydbacteria bacterium RIFCSPHIGHO2_01_FULL_49_22 TaxID=1798658 RepID=A0A1G2CU78_9BACT|nr:MAG: hypothetical protein A2845_05600 [Candidatus Lloydbacteria bacterium RIFCSPHIGHO2_01_FULL_49_22]OGZ09673.1 MAG: hypothetical protein A3C14_02910 [Candidatus Lloydbacteria bacterium RIFCSPHIGHO2_02_FULL_50_18]
MNQIRRDFVSQLACQLNNTVDYEKQVSQWLCLLLSPLLTLVILGFVPGAYVAPIFVMFIIAYLLVYIRLVSQDFVLTNAGINKVLRRRSAFRVALLATASAQWDDVDTESVGGGCCGCHSH